MRVCDSRAVLSIFIYLFFFFFFAQYTDPVRERRLEFVITVHWFPLFPHHCSAVYNIYASSLPCEPTPHLPPPLHPAPRRYIRVYERPRNGESLYYCRRQE